MIPETRFFMKAMLGAVVFFAVLIFSITYPEIAIGATIGVLAMSFLIAPFAVILLILQAIFGKKERGKTL